MLPPSRQTSGLASLRKKKNKTPEHKDGSFHPQETWLDNKNGGKEKLSFSYTDIRLDLVECLSMIQSPSNFFKIYLVKVTDLFALLVGRFVNSKQDSTGKKSLTEAQGKPTGAAIVAEGRGKSLKLKPISVGSIEYRYINKL